MIGNQFVLGLAAKLIIDLFAGGGGASTGIEQAVGRPVDIAVNHDRKALAMHQANHPQTLHLQTNVWDLEPRLVCKGRHVGALWASPDCRHFSPAKGGAPVSDRVRSLAWVVIKWATQVRPDVIFLENIPEFKNWGPLVAGRPCSERRGKTFRRWRLQLERLGYVVEFRELRAAEYETPTTRKRLFMVARCDGLPIVWPKPTNGPGLKPYLTAASCIDWTIACPSIFTRPKPLASATLRRIAHGIHRFVLENPKPFIVRIGQTGHGDMSKARLIDQPLTTVTTKAEHLLVAPALVASFLAKHYGDRGQRPGSQMDEPVSTITASDHHSLVASHLVKLRGTSNSAAANEPLATISAGGWHHAEVRALLLAYYGTDQAGTLVDPLATVTTRDRFAIVTVKGQDYVIADVGMRMLQPRELFRAQGFADTYIIEYGVDPGTGLRITLSKSDQVRMCGNSVCPNVARAVVAANYSDFNEQRLAA